MWMIAFPIFTVRAFAQVTALNSILETLTILLLAVRFWTMTSSLVSNVICSIILVLLYFGLESYRISLNDLFPGFVNFIFMIFIV